MPVLGVESHHRRIAPLAVKPESHSGGEKGQRALPVTPPVMTVQAALAAMSADPPKPKKVKG